MSSVFLSYARGDSRTAQYLHDGLEREGYTVFWDQENRFGDNWTEQVIGWLRGTDVVVVVVSPASVGSFSVQSEIQIALVDFEQKVIPLQIAPKQEILQQQRLGLWLLIRLLQRADAWPPRDALEELLRTLKREGFYPPPTSGAPNPPPTYDRNTTDMDWALSIPAPKPPPLPSGGRAQIIIELPGTLDDFDEREREGFTQLLSSLAKISPDLVRVLTVTPGSIRVTLEVPASTARWLIEAKERNDEVAQRLSIQAIRLLTVTPAEQPARASTNPLAWLRDWLGVGRNQLRLAGAGGALLVLALALSLTGVFGRGEPGGLGLCGDLSLTAGRCPEGERVAFFAGPDVSAMRSSSDRVPRVIIPRQSNLLALTPTVEWTPVEGTGVYTVTLSGNGQLLWTGLVTDTASLAYPPAGAPPLERGQRYRFEVDAGAGPETTQGIRFVVATAEEAAALEAAAQAQRERGLDASAETVLVTNLYAQEGFYADALALLRPLAGATQEPAVELLLGNLYVAVGLPDLAAAPYERVAALAATAGDRQLEALALTRLGDVLAVSGPESQARARTSYEQALAIYEEIGDDTQVRVLSEKLERLS